jgi:ribonuclease BN (tRNA processing enzyme)
MAPTIVAEYGPMLLTPLGCLAGMPAGGFASSGYLVADGSQRIMLDAGPGTAVQLSRQLDRRLTAVFVTHQHTDHVLDLLVIGKTVLTDRLRRNSEGGELWLDESVPPVPLFLPKGMLPALRTLAALFPVATHPLLDEAFTLGFAVHEYEPGEEVRVGHLSLRFDLLRHTSANCGIRIESQESSLVYTGDTGVTDRLPRLAENAGTLLCESTLRETDTSGHGHLSSQDAGRAARDAGVAELMLTHFSRTDLADLDWHRRRAAAEFDGPVLLARPGRPVTIAAT